MDDFTLDIEDTPSTALVVPVAPTADLVGAMENYQDLQRRLLSPNDWQTIQGKQSRNGSVAETRCRPRHLV